MSNRIANRNRRQRGFTLAEILVTTAIFAIIMIAALTVYDRSNQVFKSSTEQADLQQSTRIGFEKLVSDIRMAGFDYNRGGIPDADGTAPQPDEQIEYAGTNAVVFRANFNYNTSASTGNGLEPAYTPRNVSGGNIFPWVTTSNDEIIAYVLRSNDASKNTGSISFYVDDYMPRAAFPSSISPAPAGSSPSHPERTVTIDGIDTTNDNPPYTLYRVTVSDVKANPPRLGTPVAENIRSLNFSYYTDAAGTTLLKNADDTDITTGRNAGGGTFTAAGTGAIGGDGQYNPDSVGTTTNFADRSQRAQIVSVRVNLVGMNANPDNKFQEATETIAAIKNYRQYALQSLVVPRNLGLTGFPEPSFNPPAPPQIVGMCTGHCGAPVIYWQPPSVSGDVTKYRVEWDTLQTGAFSNGVDINDPTARSAVLPDDGVSDVAQQRWYRMWSYNDNGRSIASSNYWGATPTNSTRPQAPTALSGTTGQINDVPLRWTSPTSNVSPQNVLACSGTGGSTDGALIPTEEVVRYRVFRGTDPNFDPTNTNQSIMVLDTTSASQPSLAAPGTGLNWDDTGLANKSLAPPANCTPYYYRVQALDRCFKQSTWNVGGVAANSISDFYPPIGQSAMGPYQSTYSGAAPVPPPATSVDKTTPLASGCPDPTAPASSNCRVTLQWSKANSDTATPANPIGVDWYVITRGSRVQQAGGAFTPDASFGTNGQREVNCSIGVCPSGYSQTSPSALGQYVDTPPILNSGGQVLEYQYTVAAKNCTLYSGNAPHTIAEAANPPNPSVIYPGCSINPTIVEVGASNSGLPSGSSTGGDSPQDPWIFNGGDTVKVTPPGTVTVQNVSFDLFAWPAMSAVTGMSLSLNSPNNAPNNYVYTWSDQTDNQVYLLRITVNILNADNTTCQEVHVKYIQDQAQVGCAFLTNQPAPAPVINGHGSNPETDTVTVSITNTGTDNMVLYSPTFQGTVDLTWHSPDLPDHTDLQLTDVVWSANTTPPFSQTVNLCTYGSCTQAGSGTVTQPTLNAPVTMPSIPPGKTLSLRFSFKFDSRSGRPSLPTTPSAITKLCLAYQILSEPVNQRVKHCNIIGTDTNNPTSCN